MTLVENPVRNFTLEEGLAALAEVYVTKRYEIFGVIYRRVGGADRSWDITQQVFLNIAEKVMLGPFTQQHPTLAESILRYAKRTTVFLTQNDLRNASRQKTNPFSSTGNPTDTQPTFSGETLPLFAPQQNTNNPEEIFLEKERTEAIGAILDTLPHNYSSALRSHYFEGLTAEEMSEILATSKGAVKALLNRARAAFRDKLTTIHRLENPAADI